MLNHFGLSVTAKLSKEYGAVQKSKPGCGDGGENEPETEAFGFEDRHSGSAAVDPVDKLFEDEVEARSTAVRLRSPRHCGIPKMSSIQQC